MRSRSQGGVRSGGRRLLMALALGIGTVVGMLAAPSPALADHEGTIVPPLGYCVDDWYVFGTNYGQVHQPYSGTKHFDNQSSQPATWSESLSVSRTFSSTYTTSETFSGGLDLGIVKIGTDSATQTTSFWSITVNETSSFSVQVPPFTIMYAQYGAYGLHTSGTYYQDVYKCDDPNHHTLSSGAVDGFSLTSVGWRLWET